eukprot:3906464-Pyramimonas_sp.AAC.1
MWLSPWRRVHSSLKHATISRVEGKPSLICGSRLSAAHIRFERSQQLHGWRAVPFQNVALALAPRAFA